MGNKCDKSVETLIKAISLIDNEEDCKNFFDDLCTIKELQDMAQRFDTAVMLNNGKIYQDIAKEIGISTATISRVKRCLNYGNGGYKKAISLINKGNRNGN